MRVALTLWALGACALAAGGTKTPPAEQAKQKSVEAPDEREIRTTVESFHVALEQNKPQALVELFWPDALVFVDGERIASPKDLAAKVKDELGKTSVKWADEKNVGRSDGPLAFVAQLATVKEKAGGAERSVTHALTFVLRKREGSWRISHLHWSRAG